MKFEDLKHPQDFLKELSPTKIILPIILGLGVVFYIIFREFDINSVNAIDWRWQTGIFVFLAIISAAFRLFAYMWRLRVLSDYKLSWSKCFQVISIWEFSSAITPTMVGGTVVALFMLAKEKFTVGKSTTMILTIVFVDSTLFLTMTVLFWLYYGNYLISPEFAPGVYTSLISGSPWAVPFLMAFGLMLGYTLFFTYGLFFNPHTFKRMLLWTTSFGVFKRWRESAIQTGNDIIIASEGLKQNTSNSWFQLYASTWLAWTSRFFVVIFLIMAVAPVMDTLLLYGRQLVLYLILMLTPTPGGSGVADFAFKDFYADVIPDAGLATAIGAIWRLLTYYPYLILGVFVLPVWVRRVFLRKDKSSEKSTENLPTT